MVGESNWEEILGLPNPSCVIALPHEWWVVASSVSEKP